MPEVIKSDGNNKYTDRLDCRRSDWLLIFGSLEYWLCSRVEGRTWIIAIDEALNLFIWVQHLIQEYISCLLLDDEKVSLRKVTTRLLWFLHIFCKHIVIAFFFFLIFWPQDTGRNGSLWLLWISPWSENKNRPFCFVLMISDHASFNFKYNEIFIHESVSWLCYDIIFIAKIQVVIPASLSIVYLFSSFHHQEIWQAPRYQMKKKPYSSIFLVSYLFLWLGKGPAQS